MDINTQHQFDELVNGEKLTLVDFFATWCMPCKMMAPILLELDSKLSDKVNIVKLDIDKFEQIAKKYDVYSVPTMILYKNGKKIDSIIGYNTFDNMNNFLSKHI